MPTDVAIDRRTGDLLVSDGYGNARIHRYSRNGRHLSSWGESETDPGRFNIIHNIATDKDGRVQVFDPDGRMDGTGKRMRHVKVRALEDVDPELD